LNPGFEETSPQGATSPLSFGEVLAFKTVGIAGKCGSFAPLEKAAPLQDDTC
jgi:hypothetical protein